MMNINAEKIEQARRLGVTLKVGQIPTAIVRLVELIVELQARLDAIEKKRR
jgi:hypothetical protein